MGNRRTQFERYFIQILSFLAGPVVRSSFMKSQRWMSIVYGPETETETETGKYLSVTQRKRTQIYALREYNTILRVYTLMFYSITLHYAFFTW